MNASIHRDDRKPQRNQPIKGIQLKIHNTNDPYSAQIKEAQR